MRLENFRFASLIDNNSYQVEIKPSRLKISMANKLEKIISSIISLEIIIKITLTISALILMI